MAGLSDILATFEALPSHDTARVRALRRQFTRRLADTPGAEVLRLVSALLEHDTVPRFFAYELCACHEGALAIVDEGRLRRMAGRLDSWWAVDSFSLCLAGPAWRARRVPDALIMRWARSRDRWWRRAALVSTVPLNARSGGGQGDARRTLRVCTVLRADEDPMVVKALSWALRELSKRSPRAVRGFVDDYEMTLARVVVREVRSKMDTGVKRSARPS